MFGEERSELVVVDKWAVWAAIERKEVKLKELEENRCGIKDLANQKISRVKHEMRDLKMRLSRALGANVEFAKENKALRREIEVKKEMLEERAAKIWRLEKELAEKQ
jgi:chromosome segregation ATPase